MITIPRTQFLVVLHDLQRLESLHALIAANDGHAFSEMSPPQQKDVLTIASELTLEARCQLAAHAK